MNRFKKVALGVATTCTLATGNAMAALSTAEQDAIKAEINGGLTDVAAISVAVFSVLAGIWGIRKVVKLLNRS